MDVPHLQASQSGSGQVNGPGAKSSSGTDDGLTLTNLAGELQNLIITNLHPSAAIALSQTNHHFHSCVSLHRLPFSTVVDYFRDKELLPMRSHDFACYTCLRLKHRSAFAKRQTKSRRGKVGQAATERMCLDCGFTNGKHTPGSPMKIGAELQVYCFACTTLKRRFCIHCHWCDSCISKGTARGLRKGVHAGPNGEASVVEFQNICKRHDWQGGMPADSRSNLLTT